MYQKHEAVIQIKEQCLFVPDTEDVAVGENIIINRDNRIAATHLGRGKWLPLKWED
jgi:hypothetical protein